MLRDSWPTGGPAAAETAVFAADSGIARVQSIIIVIPNGARGRPDLVLPFAA